jgi:hypothetical protein
MLNTTSQRMVMRLAVKLRRWFSVYTSQDLIDIITITTIIAIDNILTLAKMSILADK